MVSIEELLPKSTIRNLAISAVIEGDVFRMRLGEEEHVRGKRAEDDGRNKYFVVLGADSEGNAIGFVLINSGINKNLPQCRKELHYLLPASKYKFLEGKDRYVDCSDFKVMSQEKFMRNFGSRSIKGTIDGTDLALMKSAVASYENASPKLLKRFGIT